MACLISRAASFSLSALAAREGSSPSEAKRRAMSWDSVSSGIRGRKEGREAQTLFQPDHAVLHFKGVEATLGDCDDGGKHDDDEPRGMDSGVANQMVDRSYQGDGEDG